MRRRRFLLGLIGLVLVLWALTAGATEPTIAYSTLERDGFREIQVNTPLVSYILSEDGGTMKSAYLTFVPYGSTSAELVPGTTTNDETLVRQYVAGTVFPFTLATANETDGRYVLQSPVEEGDGTVVVAFTGQLEGVSVTKQYTFHPDAIYTFEFVVSFENPTIDPLDVEMTLAEFIPKESGPSLYYLFDGQVSSQQYARGSYASFDGLGLMDKQIVFFLTPDDGTAVAPFIDRAASGTDRFGVVMTAETGSSSYGSSTYGGRRRYLLMQQAGIQELDNPGMGARLMIPVIRFLNMLYHATGNYGWAIILFTILIRVILYPLMRKQYHSMAKMQRLQPKLKRIQQRYKDDKQILQQRMMELYRKEGVNPMGGCLPMLIQLPIIFLIWRAILYSAEQIHLSPGFLWIPDLSLADPYFILVIVTTGIMIVQQWLMTPQTGTEGAAGTKYFGYVFPIFMAVLLWRFPAGLWLYYLLTTAAQVVQQMIVNREIAHADKMRLATEGPGDEVDEDDASGEESR